MEIFKVISVEVPQAIVIHYFHKYTECLLLRHLFGKIHKHDFKNWAEAGNALHKYTLIYLTHDEFRTRDILKFSAEHSECRIKQLKSQRDYSPWGAPWFGSVRPSFKKTWDHIIGSCKYTALQQHNCHQYSLCQTDMRTTSTQLSATEQLGKKKKRKEKRQQLRIVISTKRDLVKREKFRRTKA